MYDLSIPGHMSEQDLIYIAEVAAQVPKNGVIVELGSYKGQSSYAWGASCDHSVNVYCIDIFVPLDMTEPDFFDDFTKNTSSLPNVTPIRGIAPVLLDYPGYMIDVFFNDATHYHPYDWNNIQYFSQFIKPGGLLMGHDYSQEWPDVIDNVRRLEEELSQKVTEYPGSSIYSFRL